jgi:hypothetical protein
MATQKEPRLKRRECGTMGAHMDLLEHYPGFRARQQRLENENARRRAFGFKAAQLPLVTIKVVVNIVYKLPAQNISDAQINSQIKALNQDFRAKNPDKSKAPSVWNGMIADSHTQFQLFQVTRTQTSRTSFSHDDGVKRASGGGIAPRTPGKYLNIWVCALGGGLLGYGQFPGGPKTTDGVVINYRAFGTMGTAQNPFNKGRTATHEIGHYLNLRHIWGDTEDCSGSDFVADTPNCAGPNFGKPTFPKASCRNGPNGDMFVNYMDYVDDAAMFMFTPQQVARMRTTLDGPRRSLW